MVETNIKGPAGTLAGWDRVSLSDDSVLQEKFISVEQLYAYLKNITSVVDPRRLRAIEKTVVVHEQDSQNPHKDTLDMFVQDFVMEILSQVTPGTSPTQYPSMAYLAEFELEDTLTVVNLVRDSAITTLDRQGFFVTTDANKSAFDWATGIPTVPLFPAVTQTIPNPNVVTTNAIALTGLASSSGGVSSLKTPAADSNYLTLTETADTSEHRFSVSFPVVTGQENTSSCFIYPINAKGFLIILIKPAGKDADTTKFVTIDLTNKTASATSDGTYRGHIQVLANGWIRVGIQHIAQVTDMVEMVIYNSTYGVPAEQYTGTLGNPLLAVFGIQNTTSAGLAPYLADNTTPLAASTLSIPVSSSPVVPTRGMFGVTFTHNPSLIATTKEFLFSTGTGIAATFDDVNIITTMSMGAQVLTTTNLCPVGKPVVWSSSYDTGAFKTKTSGSTKTAYSGSFAPTDTLTKFSFGPFSGGLSQFVYYAISDNNRALEFITGEN